MRPGVRAAAALLLAASSTAYGLVAAPAAVAITPTGGCWTYVANPLDPDVAAAPVADISTGLEPWTVDDGQVLLGTTGATAVGGTRSVIIGISSGPVISALPSTGTASFVVSVDGVPLAAPLTTTYTAEAGQPVLDVVARGDIPVAAAGEHTVRLDSVYFDNPTDSTRVACNGQSVGDPGGANPATEPLPTDVTGSYVAVAGSTAAITKVTGQQVTDAARAGDTVHVHAAGLSSSVAGTAQLCADDTCADPATDVWIDQDGTTDVALVVPDTLDAGDVTARISDGTTTVEAPFTVLAAPTMSAAEKLGDGRTTVSITGTAWDPAKKVVVRGYTDGDATTSDPKVTVDADDSGDFTATFVVTDKDTATIGATQQRGANALTASYEFSGQVGIAPVDPVEPTDPVDPGVTDPGTVIPPVTVPGEPIPEPDDIPVEEVPGVDPGTETPGDATAPADLAVTEQHLAGHATLGELFGGAPKRDLVFLLENVGDTTVDNPIVRVSVGRSEEIEPEVVDVQVDSLDPGEQTVVTVPLELPIAAFGNYRVVGQVGDTPAGAFEVEWKTYPWGLIGLNVLALMLLAWGIRSRMVARRPAPFAPGVASTDALIDLAAAEGWWTYRAGGPRPVPGVAPAAVRAPAEEEGGAAVVDLGAAEKWWARRGSDKPSQVS